MMEVTGILYLCFVVMALVAHVVRPVFRRAARVTASPLGVLIGDRMGQPTQESLEEVDALAPNSPPIAPRRSNRRHEWS